MREKDNINELLKTEMAELKPFLPKDWAKDTANKLNVSESTVRHACNGRFANKRVMIELIELAKAEQKKILQTLNN